MALGHGVGVRIRNGGGLAGRDEPEGLPAQSLAVVGKTPPGCRVGTVDEWTSSSTRHDRSTRDDYVPQGVPRLPTIQKGVTGWSL